MKRRGGLIVAACLLVVWAGGGMAAEKDPVNTVVQGCQKELETYCKDVTPGKGRILACLYAHEDKLTGRCEYALYDAAKQLQQFVASLTYLVNECADDLRKLCASVPAGEGRLLACLKQNEAKVSDRCKQAQKDVGAQQ